MVKIYHYYLKIIDNLENSKKMILIQNNYDIRCSKPKSFPRIFFCICTNNEDMKVYKINWIFYILLYNFSFSCIANNLCKIAKIKIKIQIKKYKKNRQLDSALIFINICSFIRRAKSIIETIAVDQSCSLSTLFVSITNIIDVDRADISQLMLAVTRFAGVTTRLRGTPVVGMYLLAKLFLWTNRETGIRVMLFYYRCPRYVLSGAQE